MQQASNQPSDPPLFPDWMSQVSPDLQNAPLNSVAIPGSHDSFSFYLNKDGDLGPDVSRVIRDLAKVFGATVKDIVYRWSTTQTLSITKQLLSGIRYFDLRITKKPKSEDTFFLHGLYGEKVETELVAIRSFLKDHPKEVVLLDCNHFYCMNEFDHKQCLSMFLEILGDVMCPYLDMNSVTLETMWKNKLQVLVFYHCDIIQEYLQFWPGSSVPSPWANTDNTAKLIKFLDHNYSAGRDKDTFYVSQGILTPDDTYVVRNMTKSLRECLSAPFAPHFTEWVKTKEQDSSI